MDAQKLKHHRQERRRHRRLSGTRVAVHRRQLILEGVVEQLAAVIAQRTLLSIAVNAKRRG